jgi:3-oxoadipate enol-lactonase
MLEDDHHIMVGEFVTTTSMVNVDGARVAYRLHGRGPAVVLVNGTAALDARWGPVIAEFSKHRTVISLDYSGSGDTTDDGSVLSLQKLARQVREVVRAAGVERFDLVGHSLGAAIAIQLASSSADLVRSLIVVAGFSRGAEPRLKLQFELWLDLLRTNRDAFLRLLLLSGLTPAFVSSVGASTIEDMIKGYMPLANWEGITRQVELDLAVDVSEQARSVPHACHQLCSRSDRHADTRAGREHSRRDVPTDQCRAPGLLRGSR